MQFDKDRTSVGLSAIRGKRYSQIANGGWHFSYFGGVDRIRDKVGSFAESYLDLSATVRGQTDAQIAQDILGGEDIYHRGIYSLFTRRETNDPRLPAYFLNNVARYKHLTEEGLRWST